MNTENMVPPSYEDEIELIDILRVLWKRKLLIGALVIIGVLTAFLFVQVKYPKIKTATCQVSLSFPGIETHKNPDGTAFEKKDLLLPRVLAEAEEHLTKAFGKEHTQTIHEILQTVEIVEVVPEEIRKKITAAQKSNTTFSYWPTTFDIKALSLKTADVSDDLMKTLLLEVVGSFKRYFEERYGLEPLVKIEFTKDFVETTEFYDVVNVFQTYSNKLIGFLDQKIEIAGYFRSKTSGYTFVDVKNEVKLLQDVHIKPLQAIVTNSRMTREMDALISQLENQIMTLSATKQKKELAADVSRSLLKEMRKDASSASLSSSSDIKENLASGINLDSGLYEEIRKNDYRSFLLKSIIDAEVEAINSAVDLETLKKEIEKIKNEEKNAPRAKAVVDRMNKVKDYLITYSRMADEINAEYLSKKIRNSITIVRLPLVEKVREKNIRLILVLALFGSLFIAVFVAFFYEYISHHLLAAPSHSGTPGGLIETGESAGAVEKLPDADA